LKLTEDGVEAAVGLESDVLRVFVANRTKSTPHVPDRNF